MVPLFHDNPVSTAPRGKNWGEVVRLYPPGSTQFKYLYGARNDTEARHADLKARVKHLPHDVLGQELRLLGASMAINAIAWQVHLYALGLGNVLRRHRLATSTATVHRLGPGPSAATGVPGTRNRHPRATQVRARSAAGGPLKRQNRPSRGRSWVFCGVVAVSQEKPGRC